MSVIEGYLARGWGLVPIHDVSAGRCSCGQDCGKSAGKHPRFGGWQANPLREASYWRTHPCANVGIVTGRPSGHWVLDWDPGTPGLGRDSYELLMRVTAEIPGAHVNTGSGGSHWRFALPADFEPTNSAGRLPRGWDVRGTGGQVVAPPSVSAKGPYTTLTDAPPYAPLGWLLDLIRPSAAALPGSPGRTTDHSAGGVLPGLNAFGDNRGQRYAAAAVSAACAELAEMEEGGRDAKAFTVACRLHELINAPWSGLDPHRVHDLYLGACAQASANGVSPFTEGEAEKCWRNGHAKVAGVSAVLPPDPLAAEVMPLPTAAAGAGVVPPFAFIEPGTPGVASAAQPAPDPFEAEVGRQMTRLAAAEEARRRLEAAKLGDRDTRLAAMRGELLKASELDMLPPLQPLIEGYLYKDTLARLNGKPNHGKTFVALDIAACVATGTSWHGHQVRQGRGLYLLAEGGSGMRARRDAWQKHHNRDIGDNLIFMPRAVQILGPEWPLLIEVAAEARPDLIVVDTQARHTAGLNENASEDMGRVVLALADLQAATGACVLLVHHATKAGAEGGRGHNSVEGATHSELFTAASGNNITVKTTKQKDGPKLPEIIFTLNPVGDSAVLVAPQDTVRTVDGQFIEPASVVDVGRVRALALVSVLVDNFSEGNGGLRADIRSLFLAHPVIRELTPENQRKAFTRAWGRLEELGRLARNPEMSGPRLRFVELDGLDHLAPNPNLHDLAPFGWPLLWTDKTSTVTESVGQGPGTRS